MIKAGYQQASRYHWSEMAEKTKKVYQNAEFSV